MRLSSPCAALSALLLSGCATFSADGGLAEVSAMTSERTGMTVQRDRSADDAAASRAIVSELLAVPLTPDAAVRVALANNKALQAAFADLAIAEAQRVRAGRIGNPGFSFARLRGGDQTEIERSVSFDLIGLLLLPMRSSIEAGRFEQAKLQAAAQAVSLAADTRKAYFTAVAAQQSVLYAQQVADAAEAGAALAQRMAKAGNWSRLDQAREQVFFADATARLARARHEATAAREQLTRLLGLSGDDIGYALPDRLPDLPASPREASNIEAQAMAQRLDVQIAMLDAEATARGLGLTRATAFVNVFDAGYANKSTTGNPRENGYTIALELPLFDWGGARTARAEASYMQSVHRAADIAVRARSEVREAYSAYRSTHDVARHYRDQVIPLKKQISDEVLLRYNGMLASVFELLADAREQVASVNAAIEAQRDFWIAEAGLQAAINGSGGAPTRMRTATPGAAVAREH